MSVAIVTDSSSDIPKNLVEKYDITVVPLYILFGNETFKDEDRFITHEEFYSRIKEGTIMPKTSQPTPGDFLEKYRELLKKHDSIINILISRKMSGTIDSAELAKKELPNADITIVDSEMVHMPTGYLAIKAAELALQGKPKEEILKAIEIYKQKITVLFIPSTLEYLKRGGRIGRSKALLASLLEIKPILTLNFGEVSPFKNTRRWSQAKIELLNTMESLIKDISSLHIFVGDSDMKEEGDDMAEKIKEKFGIKEILRGDIGCIVGCHLGPGAVDVTFYED